MKYITKLKPSEDVVITLPEGWAEPGEKVSIVQRHDGVMISKMKEIEIDLDDATFLKVAKLAHAQDITFNDMCAKILEEKLQCEVAQSP